MFHKEMNASEPLRTSRKLQVMSKWEQSVCSQKSQEGARSCPGDIRLTGGMTLEQAISMNVGTLTVMKSEK